MISNSSNAVNLTAWFRSGRRKSENQKSEPLTREPEKTRCLRSEYSQLFAKDLAQVSIRKSRTSR